MSNSSKLFGHLAVFLAYTIFGFNIIVCKELSNSNIISPLGLFFFRAMGATVLFWITSLFLWLKRTVSSYNPSLETFKEAAKRQQEHVEKKDLLKIFIASMLGLFLTQYTFLKGITLTTSLDCSIIIVTTPIFTMFVAAIVLKEPITIKKALGVVISFVGILALIFYSAHTDNGVTKTSPIGVIYLLSNCLCFALYLGTFRPLISKYSVVTFMKWMFLFSFIASIPFSFKEISSLDYSIIPKNYYMELAFLVICSTFIAYFLIPIGQKRLRPTVISLYTYVQPLIASGMSIYLKQDTIGWQKILAAVAVITGVVLVNKSRAAENNNSSN